MYRRNRWGVENIPAGFIINWLNHVWLFTILLTKGKHWIQIIKTVFKHGNHISIFIIILILQNRNAPCEFIESMLSLCLISKIITIFTCKPVAGYAVIVYMCAVLKALSVWSVWVRASVCLWMCFRWWRISQVWLCLLCSGVTFWKQSWRRAAWSWAPAAVSSWITMRPRRAPHRTGKMRGESWTRASITLSARGAKRLNRWTDLHSTVV